MKMKAKSQELNHVENPFWGGLIKGTLIALCVSLTMILIFAFLLKFTNIPDSAITPINQVIKGASIFLGVFLGLRKIKELGLVTGLLIGLVYTILAFIVFSILSGGFTFNLTLLTDMIFGAVIGAICGIICVNIKKK